MNQASHKPVAPPAIFILRGSRKEKETEKDTSFLNPMLTLNTAVVPFKFLPIPTPYYSLR